MPERVTNDVVRTYLGRPRFFYEELAARTSQPGVAIGVGVSSVGGDIMFIEASRMAGKGSMQVTGQLGDVMKESAQAAMSYVRSRADELAIDPAVFQESDIHVHVPAGAIPKDGPSAGVAMTTSLVSLLSGIPVREDVAMTGEISLARSGARRLAESRRRRWRHSAPVFIASFCPSETKSISMSCQRSWKRG